MCCGRGPTCSSSPLYTWWPARVWSVLPCWRMRSHGRFLWPCFRSCSASTSHTGVGSPPLRPKRSTRSHWLVAALLRGPRSELETAVVSRRPLFCLPIILEFFFQPTLRRDIFCPMSNDTPQFTTAEYAGPPGDHCAFCRQPVTASYYRVNGSMACAGCAERLKHEEPEVSHQDFLRALTFGIGAAILGLTLYAGFTILTGFYIGYVSLAVGWLNVPLTTNPRDSLPRMTVLNQLREARIPRDRR